jgi:hypothetical protein
LQAPKRLLGKFPDASLKPELPGWGLRKSTASTVHLCQKKIRAFQHKSSLKMSSSLVSKSLQNIDEMFYKKTEIHD